MHKVAITLHTAKQIADLCVRIRQRAINQARDAEFLSSLIESSGKLEENIDEVS